MSGKSKASKDQASSANPLSDLSSGAESAAVLANNGNTPGDGSSRNGNGGNSHNGNNHTPNTPASPSSVKSRNKSPIEPKTQKPSFLSLIFCCGANFVNDSDASLQVNGPARPAAVTPGNVAGKKPVVGHATTDEKALPVQPTVEVPITTVPIDVQDGDHSIPQDAELAGLLGPIAPEHIGKKCLVLDLDETLVHSSFKLIPQADYVVPVEIDNQSHNVYVIKRPGVDTFLQKMGELYEVVIFTASLSKDLSVIGRDLKNTIIIDNSPASYIFHQTNAVPISSWFNDPHDTELLDLIPFLADMTVVDDVNPILDMVNEEQ
ncbi:hypothetical protein BGZ51_003528 [Haplosporangium sp. Z 767]|nr:hypothetical protein BGZ51_003528 [Haplosporangium sp. Z 767]KAF9191374.1 hypothetical protein BGZ50_009429 [Haplosporangium sp. Z 11]